MTRRASRQNAEAGNALVEFAVSLVLILTVLFGIIDLGRALYAFDWISDAARRGTRFAMVRGTQCQMLTGGCPASGADVTAYVTSLATGIDIGQLQVATLCQVGGVFTAPPPCAPKGWVQVTVSYQFQFLSPFAPYHWRMQSLSQRVVQN